ncbi:MAG TPA: hypothetical protein PKE26_04985 [Kiritimatiellia bacterium]|nr:hypothetical protein [Kiritimatiellia bacterium]HMO98446.1 hypothetical protein [Kiritimatiellia bacterium]HMP95864.1 hypothetical protein [Kiritimatiellia bacterium]
MKRRWFNTVLTAALLHTGCATVPYRPGVTYIDPRLPAEPLGEEQIVRGKPHRWLDKSDWIWPGSWLGKLILWDRRVDNHTIGEETEAIMLRYLEINDLQHVKVRLNAYHVRDEWRRLVANKSVGAGWRYTIGVLTWLHYTILPGRFFGGDHYNPWSNTIHLYSDIPAIALHEGGHAKDFANRKWKGAYGFVYIIPLVALYHEAIATSDALGYLLAEENVDLQREGYQIMYPAYGTYLGGGFEQVVPIWNPVMFIAGVIGGHIVGRAEARRLPAESPVEPD